MKIASMKKNALMAVAALSLTLTFCGCSSTSNEKNNLQDDVLVAQSSQSSEPQLSDREKLIQYFKQHASEKTEGVRYAIKEKQNRYLNDALYCFYDFDIGYTQKADYFFGHFDGTYPNSQRSWKISVSFEWGQFKQSKTTVYFYPSDEAGVSGVTINAELHPDYQLCPSIGQNSTFSYFVSRPTNSDVRINEILMVSMVGQLYSWMNDTVKKCNSSFSLWR